MIKEYTDEMTIDELLMKTKPNTAVVDEERTVVNVITHTDLDGAGCSVIANVYARQIGASITVKYCDYGNVDEEVNRLINLIDMAGAYHTLEHFKHHIIIADISVNIETAQKLVDLMMKCKNVTVSMIDHHQVKDAIRAFSWVYVDASYNVCGTSLLRDFLNKTTECNLKSNAITQFAEDVCLYDTWRFDKENETNSENLNILLYLIGIEEFVFLIQHELLSNPSSAFYVYTSNYYAAVDHDRYNREKYCALRNHNIIKTKYKGYNVGIVFAERYISTVGDYVLRKNDDIDFCAIVNLPSSVSLRTRSDDINMGIDIARPLGGGGHQKAAGFQLKNIHEELIKEIIGFDK